MSRISRIISSEVFFVGMAIFVLLLLNVLPYWYGDRIKAADEVFMGEPYNILDTVSYYSNMQQGAEHGLMIYNQYTSETQQPAPIFIFYAVAGIIAKFVSISAPVMLFICRIAFGIFLFGVIYLFIKQFISERFWRRITFLIVCFGSGVGWFFQLIHQTSPYLFQYPVDLWLPDAVPVQRLLNFPHDSLAHALFLLIIIFFYRFFQLKQRRYIFIASVMMFILNFIEPFHALVLYGVLVVYSIILIIYKRYEFSFLKYTVYFLLISLPALIYMIYLALFNPIWSKVQVQNIITSPSLINVVFGYGFILYAACLGISRVFRTRHEKLFIIVSWVFAVAIMTYLPFASQRRFMETALFVPLSILAVLGIQRLHIRGFWFQQKKVFIISLVIVVSCLSSLFVLINLFNLLKPGPIPYYVPRKDISALRWLAGQTPNDSIILSSFFSGLIVPYFGDRRVYIGHRPETISLDVKQKKVDSFYNIQYSDSEAQSFLKGNNISYVLFFSFEKRAGYKDPAHYSFLKKIYQQEDNVIYQFEN